MGILGLQEITVIFPALALVNGDKDESEVVEGLVEVLSQRRVKVCLFWASFAERNSPELLTSRVLLQNGLAAFPCHADSFFEH